MIGLLLLAWLGCGDPPGPPPSMEVAGCDAVDLDNTCRAPAEQLVTVWSDAPDSNLFLDDQELPPLDAIQGGRRWRLPHPGTGRLCLEHRRARRCAGLQPVETPAWVAEVRDHILAGRLDSASERLAPLAGGQADTFRARLAFRQGDVETAVTLLRRAITEHLTEGRVRRAVDDSLMLSWLARSRGLASLADVRVTLDDLGPLLDHDAEGRAKATVHRAYLERDTGDLRAALALLTEAIDAAERIGLGQVVTDASQIRATLLAEVGRHDDAAAVWDRLAAHRPEQPCRAAEYDTNHVWAGLLHAEAGGPVVPPARLAQVEANIESTCPQPGLWLNARVNRVLGAIQRGAGAEAARLLAGLDGRDADGSSESLAWLADLRARTHLLQGEPAEALSAWSSLLARADQASEPAAAWRARVGRAQAHAALGDLDAAVREAEAAEAVLVHQAIAIPLGSGRGTFLADHGHSARLLVDLLITAGRPGDAIEAARTAHTRALTSLARIHRLSSLDPASRVRWDEAVTRWRALRREAERDAGLAWTLPVDQLEVRDEELGARLDTALDSALATLDAGGDAPPLATRPPGQTWLVYHPVEDGLAGMVWDDTGTTVARLGPLEPGASDDALSRQLLDPFAAGLSAATRLRIIAWGPVRQIDIHALPWRGGVLMDVVPVAWGVDIAGSVPPGAGTLVVGDPRGDLPAARVEAEQVHSAVGGRLLLGEQAHAGAVREALPGLARLHYAGHAAFGDGDGWESALRLADGSALSVGDILALDSAPHFAVLSGCETARTAETGSLAGLGLAPAFVLAGSHQVIAATRPVPDALAARLSVAIHRTQESEDAAVALQHAVRRVRASSPDSDWAAWRVIER